MSQVSVELVSLSCPACGGSVPIADAERVACPFCGSATAVPEAHRQAVRLVRAQDDELRRAEKQWQSYAKKTLPNWVAKAASVPPSVILSSVVAVALLDKLGAIQAWTTPRRVIGLGVLPLAPAIALAAMAYWSTVRENDVRVARLALAARPGKVPCCRSCGAALAVSDGATFVRCPYCRADSLVTLDALQARALSDNVQRAHDSASAALEAGRARRAKTLQAGKVLGSIFLGAVALLFVWGFAPFLDFVLVLMFLDMLTLSTLTYALTLSTLLGRTDPSVKPAPGEGWLVLLLFVMAVISSATVWYVAE
jgi:predicted RNA-binding Zn-ribbon protein involved in translation (DUF1610 family)